MGIFDNRVVSVTPKTTMSLGNNNNRVGSGNTMFDAVQAAQDKANAANEARYQQQLGTYDASLKNLKSQGTQANARINTQERDNNSAGAASLISRGLYNSSSLNAEQTRNTQNANDARQGVNESVARQQNAVLADKANAIGARNDVGPDMNMFSALQQSAAQAAQSQAYGKPVITTTNGNINDPIFPQQGGAQVGAPAAQGGEFYRAPQQPTSNLSSMLQAFGQAGGQTSPYAAPPAPKPGAESPYMIPGQPGTGLPLGQGAPYYMTQADIDRILRNGGGSF